MILTEILTKKTIFWNKFILFNAIDAISNFMLIIKVKEFFFKLNFKL